MIRKLINLLLAVMLSLMAVACPAESARRDDGVTQWLKMAESAITKADVTRVAEHLKLRPPLNRSDDPTGLAGGENPYSYVHNPLTWIDPLGLAGCRNSFDQAMNKALKWLEERGFKAEKVNIGKFGSTKGKPVGMTTADGRTGFRIEYDERSGAHINVFSGKEKGEHFLFKATESSVTRLQRLFNLPSKLWRGQ